MDFLPLNKTPYKNDGDQSSYLVSNGMQQYTVSRENLAKAEADGYAIVVVQKGGGTQRVKSANLSRAIADGYVPAIASIAKAYAKPPYQPPSLEEQQRAQLEGEVGAGELAGTLASGSVGAMAGGVNTAASLAAGRGATDAVRRGRLTQEALTYQPRTEAGQGALAIVSRPGEMLHEKAGDWGGRVTDVTGSPALGALTATAVEGAPLALPGVPKALRAGGRAVAPAAARAAEAVTKARSGIREIRANPDVEAALGGLQVLRGAAAHNPIAMAHGAHRVARAVARKRRVPTYSDLQE